MVGDDAGEAVIRLAEFLLDRAFASEIKSGSSGIVMPKSPSSRAIRMSSSGIASCSSIQRERGSTSCSTNRRSASQNCRTSGESSIGISRVAKSRQAPSLAADERR
jgi:hypothetical protein